MSKLMKISKKVLWTVSIIVLIVLGIFWFNGNISGGGIADKEVVPTGNIGFNVGDSAPDFSIKDVDGDSYSLSQFKGKPVLFAYFATWCAPCQIEANTVKKLDDELGGDKFEVYQIGVDNKETNNDLKNFKEQFGNDDWIVGFGFDVANQYGVRTLDTTFIVNEEGVIVYRDNGIPASKSTLRRWLS